MTDIKGRPETTADSIRGLKMKKFVILAVASLAVLSSAACTTIGKGKGKAPAPVPAPVVSRAG
jgi:hypothetical protein